MECSTFYSNELLTEAASWKTCSSGPINSAAKGSSSAMSASYKWKTIFMFNKNLSVAAVTYSGPGL
jgi:hypothetical protein